MELLGALTLAELGRDGRRLDDLDAREPNPVTRCHLGVHLLNRAIQSGVPILLVHVVIAGSALIPQPDAVVLDLGRILLKYLHDKEIQR